MTVILEAFGGKLRSEPMHWPEDSPPTIRMRLDNPVSAEMFDSPGLVRSHVCTFQMTGQYEPVSGSPISAAVYRLVGING